MDPKVYEESQEYPDFRVLQAFQVNQELLVLLGSRVFQDAMAQRVTKDFQVLQVEEVLQAFQVLLVSKERRGALQKDIAKSMVKKVILDYQECLVSRVPRVLKDILGNLDHRALQDL